MSDEQTLVDIVTLQLVRNHREDLVDTLVRIKKEAALKALTRLADVYESVGVTQIPVSAIRTAMKAFET